MASNDPIPRRRLSPGHFLLLGLLLAPPVLAVQRGLGSPASGWIGGWAAAVSWFTYLIYAWDKQQAREKEQREPERLLHGLELAGGWPGAFLAQQRLRHKSAKFAYQLVFWLIVLLYELVAVDYLLGWPLWRQFATAIK